MGYVLFYNLEQFFQNPLYLLRIWEGGMSFHGGFIGVALARIFHQTGYSDSKTALGS